MISCSIIICTRNRAEHLRKTLAAIGAVAVPTGMETEVIVVDNASTDQTAEVAKSARLANVTCRYVHEARGGQCFARNTGMAEATGQIIVFTDDDVVPCRDWLGAICSPIVDGRADAVAGAIQIAPELQRPWMKAMHRGWLASTECDSAAAPRMVGANMAFSRRVLEKVPTFDTELGPGRLGFGDDVVFAEQLAAAGYRIVAAPDAVVVHHFDPARLTRASFLDAARKHGRTMAYVDLHWRRLTPRRLGTRRVYAVARLAAWRACHPLQFFRTEGAEVAEMYHVQNLHYVRQLRREQQRVGKSVVADRR